MNAEIPPVADDDQEATPAATDLWLEIARRLFNESYHAASMQTE
jgi:hypothetical protein